MAIRTLKKPLKVSVTLALEFELYDHLKNPITGDIFLQQAALMKNTIPLHSKYILLACGAFIGECILLEAKV